jgi:hypothetical protein
LIALFYAPLPQPWDLFLGLVVVLTGFFWITLLLGLALIVLLAVQVLARHFADRDVKCAPR